MQDKTEISVIIPLYNEEDNIERLIQILLPVLNQLNRSWEIIFIDDGSKDRSFELVKEIHEQNPDVTGIALSRNFGHQIALLAGLHRAKGDVVIMMDADLQHPPEVIPRLLEASSRGYDIVNTRRIDAKGTGWFKKVSSRGFYRLMNFLSDIPITESSSDFRLMSKKALGAFLKFQERDRFTRGLISWMGFNQTIIDYECPPRLIGTSKYTLRKMLHFALDGITSFSAKPLRIASYSGMIVFFIGLLYALFAIIQYFRGANMPGWTSLLVTVLIIGGIQLLAIGIIGEYLARIFHESKARPIYFIKDQTP
ncbi:MAG: glycosyltransferase family 2 protein [Bacteroidales bacterium]|nr:glycosyltransferase family 2 protein [Bacteroidales bacterium]